MASYVARCSGYSLFANAPQTPKTRENYFTRSANEEIRNESIYLEQRLHPGSIAIEVRAVEVDRRVRFGDPRRSRAVREPAGGGGGRESRNDGKRGVHHEAAFAWWRHTRASQRAVRPLRVQQKRRRYDAAGRWSAAVAGSRKDLDRCLKAEPAETATRGWETGRASVEEGRPALWRPIV